MRNNENLSRNWLRITILIGLAGTMALTGFAQAPWVASVDTAMTLGDRERFARPLLLQAEEFAATLDPSDESLLLYRTAGAWLALDKARAIRLYRVAFTSAMKFEPDSLRPTLQEAILNDLVPLSPSDVLDLLPSTEPKTQNRLYSAVLNFYLMEGDLSSAVRAFDQSCERGQVSERATTHLIAALDNSSTLVSAFPAAEATRSHVFENAFQAYQKLDISDVEPWTISRLIARVQGQFPAEIVLPAVAIVLTRAAEKDKASPVGSGGFASGNNSISYDSRYDLELFAVAPALMRLDPARAQLLLSEHPKAAEYLKQFPGGLPAFAPDDFNPSSYALGRFSSDHVTMGLQLYNSEVGAHSAGLNALDMGLEFTLPNLHEGLGVTGSGVFNAYPGSAESELYKRFSGCSGTGVQFLRKASSVTLARKEPFECSGPTGGMWCSYRDEFPRADLLQAVAEACTNLRAEATAKLVLQEQMRLISQIQPEHQTEYLAWAADLYLRLDDKDNAMVVVKQGFVTAKTLLERNLAAPGLKDVPKAFWPATESYRRMIALGVNASYATTEAVVRQIDDPVLREYEEIMVARALLGVPVRRYFVKTPSGSLLVDEADPSYDQL